MFPEQKQFSYCFGEWHCTLTYHGLTVKTCCLNIFKGKYLHQKRPIKVETYFCYLTFRCSTKHNLGNNNLKNVPIYFPYRVQLGEYISFYCGNILWNPSSSDWVKTDKKSDSCGVCTYFYPHSCIHPLLMTEHPISRLPQYWVQERIKR